MAALALYLLLLLHTGHCYLTSAPAQITPRPNAYPAAALGEVEHGQQIDRRATTDFCDDHGIFYCPTGTCYEYQGLIGCCSVSSCAPRTTCIEYDPHITGEPCDRNIGGCLYCNDPAAPHCRTQTNPLSSQYNHYCDMVGGTVTVTTGIFASPTFTGIQDDEALQPSVVTTTSISADMMPSSIEDTQGPAPERSPSYGFIIGIACGVGAATILAAAGFWYFRSRYRSHGEEQGHKHRTMEETTTSSANHDGADGVSNGQAAVEKIQTAAVPIPLRDSGTNHRPADDSGAPTPGLTYDTHDGSQYTVTSRELNPTSLNDSSIRDFATSYASAVEAPSGRTDRPLLTGTLSVSPSIANHTALSLTRSGLQPPSPNTSYTPYTPSQYHATAPDSIAKPFLHPPSLPQDYSAATFVSDATRAPAGSYTPSNYQPGAPESVARAAPPNLPQEYSAATLATDDDGSPVYRGLRSSSSNAFPPYAYLSPEDALAGGWTNDSPPRA